MSSLDNDGLSYLFQYNNNNKKVLFEKKNIIQNNFNSLSNVFDPIKCHTIEDMNYDKII